VAELSDSRGFELPDIERENRKVRATRDERPFAGSGSIAELKKVPREREQVVGLYSQLIALPW
jgi:hypothetical protein